MAVSMVKTVLLGLEVLIDSDRRLYIDTSLHLPNLFCRGYFSSAGLLSRYEVGMFEFF